MTNTKQHFYFSNDFESFFKCIKEQAFSDPPSLIYLETNEHIDDSEANRISLFCQSNNSNLNNVTCFLGESKPINSRLRVDTNVSYVKKE